MIFGVVAQQPELNSCGHLKELLLSRMPVNRGLVNTRHGYDVHYYRCNWQGDPRINGNLGGSVFAGINILKNTDSLGFDLVDYMVIDSVVYHQVKLNFVRNTDNFFCLNSAGFQAGLDSIEIFYHGNASAAGGLGYFSLEYHSTGPILSSLSEPYGAKYWWPCKQTLSDKVDSLDIFITTHQSQKAGTNGLLVNQWNHHDSLVTYHWKHRYPIAVYLVAIAISNYKEYNQFAHFHNRQDSLLIQNYYFPQNATAKLADMQQTPRIMRLYDSLFGQYPFAKEKYGHAEFTRGGGMEHQTMSYMVSFDFDLNAHEMAHQWFGNKITCGSWVDLWLNEGFATYTNAMANEFLKGRPAFHKFLVDMRNSALDGSTGSVKTQDTVKVNELFSGRLRYNKAAFLLHMLRNKIGDAAYFSGIREYLTDTNLVYGFARTPALIRHFEKTCNCKLDTFFKRWYEGEGYPILNIQWIQNGKEVSVNIEQNTANPLVPLYELRVPILFRGQSHDTLLFFNLNQNTQNFKFYTDLNIDSANFDPEITVLAKWQIGGYRKKVNNNNKFYISPNPTKGKVNIHTTNPVNWVSISVYDAMGKIVINKQIKNNGQSTEYLDLEKYAPGAYFAKITLDNSQFIVKFVLQ